MKRILALLVVLWGSTSHAFPFKCDKEQLRCEVQTRRLTLGDKVGIFTSEKKLVAIGEVVDIVGTNRIVKITKKWSILLNNHDVDIINDNAFQNPGAYYQMLTPLPPMSWAAQLSIINLGVGDGFLAMELSGLFFKRFWRDLSYFGRLHYLAGSGEASDNLGGAGSQSVSVSSLGVSGGVSEILMADSPVAIRLDGELGFSYGDVKLGGGFDEKKVLNNRFADGIGIYMRGGANAVWRRDGLQPEIGLAFLLIHGSTNSAFVLGVNRSFR